jgi:hypothetical protein
MHKCTNNGTTGILANTFLINGDKKDVILLALLIKMKKGSVLVPLVIKTF